MQDVLERKKPLTDIPSTELTGKKRQVEKQQDKYPGKDQEIVEHESPEVHGESDPRF